MNPFDQLEGVQQYFADLKLFAQIIAIAVTLGTIAIVALLSSITVALYRLVTIAERTGKHQVWVSNQTFRPTPNNPVPPPQWNAP